MSVALAPERTAVTLTIDGRAVEVPVGTSVLDAAQKTGVVIPTLCHHPALPPDGSCRLCVVEITGRPGLHPACVLAVAGGLDVRTETAVTVEARRHYGAPAARALPRGRGA
jgi:NADH dehydrogenase/NADH:ubiquinone oxidoreductase subunit G